MRRVKVTISYDGSIYSGWQRQENALSVQEVVENAIEQIVGEKIKIYSSGRTDEGVHAIGQVFHFDDISTIPTTKFYLALNSKLPQDIVAVKSEEVEDNFNARYDAKKKTYLYKMYFGDVDLPFERKYKLRIDKNINVELMNKGAKYLVGVHDFVGFSSTGSIVSSTIRQIYDVSFQKVENELHMRICGNGFLYNMVRIIVGTLIDIGNGKYPPNQIEKVLEQKERSLAGKTAKSIGLYLESVEY